MRSRSHVTKIQTKPSEVPKAVEILQRGAQHIADRAASRDTPQGERSMKKAVDAFNAIFGHNLSERQGWQFMEILKIARSSNGGHNPDDYEDAAAYAALAGECADAEQKDGAVSAMGRPS